MYTHHVKINEDITQKVESNKNCYILDDIKVIKNLILT